STRDRIELVLVESPRKGEAMVLAEPFPQKGPNRRNRLCRIVVRLQNTSMSEKISLQGPVELIHGRLTLQISLAAGGDKLGPLARGIGEIDGENLNVVIQPWLAEKLRINVC